MTGPATPHFDATALLTAVHQQDCGLRVSTNNPTGFRRIVYQAMRAQPALRIHIYADPRSASAFYLLKSKFTGAAQELPEPVEESADA